MNKTIRLAALGLALVFASAQTSFAADTATFDVSASVDSSLTLNVSLFEALPNGQGPGSPITEIAFGQLEEMTFDNPNGAPFKELRSSDNTGLGAAVALISANSHGVQYTIHQDGSLLTSGAATIPSGACVVNPAYSSADNGGAGIVGDLGDGGPWFGDRVLYTSDGSGSIRTIQAYYSITGDPGANAQAVVPVNQAAGNYTGQVTFTVVAV